MQIRSSAGLIVALCLLMLPRLSAAADDVTLFRLFLKDGSTLVSYGEFARVGDRVIFSMPTSAAVDNPPLHLVNLSADRVDWDHTNRYTESMRAARYIQTAAERDYAALTERVAQTLNDIGRTTDASKRLAIVEGARKLLADWPNAHYFYRAAEVRQMLGLLDEAIANLRAAAGGERFDLSLIAWTDGPPVEPPLPALTPQQAIEQTLTAARLAETSAERVSLLSAAVFGMDRDASELPAGWMAEARAVAHAAIYAELETDREYQALSAKAVSDAARRARYADVRGVERVLAEVRQRDAELGGKRPDAVNAILATVESALDSARQLRLARDRWSLRGPALKAYRAAMAAPFDVFATLGPALESIKSLAGSPPGSLVAIERAVSRIKKLAASIPPPDELRAPHALLISAADMAENAARIRREAILSGSMPRAWDASSAAAGALMLCARAKSDIESALRPPQFAAAAHP